MLHHVEKLVLGLAILLFGTLFYLGFSTKSFQGDEPDELAERADRTHAKMVEASWNKIEGLREARDDIGAIVKAPVDLNPSRYVLGPFRGTPAKMAGKRGDPEILGIEGLMAQSIPFSAFMQTNKADSWRGLKLASSSKMAAPAHAPPGGIVGRGGDIGGGGRADGGRGEASRGGGRGGFAQGGGRDDEEEDKPRRQRRDEDDLVVKPGVLVPGYLLSEMKGVRPRVAAIAASGNRVSSFPGVVVTGVIRYKSQWDIFNAVFQSAQGYWPLRDRPIFRYLEIQRKEAGGPDDESEWRDISATIASGQKGYYSALAPEVVAPENWDPILTITMPPYRDVDYSPYAVWPLPGEAVPENMHEIAMRSYDDEPEEVVEEVDQSDADAFDFGGARDEAPAVAASNVIRLGSDMAAYMNEASKTKIPSGDVYKLVRFVDLTRKTTGMTYTYRVRAWLADPNHADPNAEFVFEGGDDAGRGGGGRSPGGPMGGPRGGGMAQPGGREGGRGVRGPSGPQDREDGESDNSVRVTVKETMLKKDVRDRLRLNRPELPLWIDLALSDADASTAKKEAAKKLKNLLKYCRPTEWSEVTVTVEARTNSAVYSGRIEPAKVVRLNRGSVVDGEPTAQVAVTSGDKTFGVDIPFARIVRRGEYLNFTDSAHVAHPISMAVYLMEDYEAKTNSLVVDIMGGDEIKELTAGRDAKQYHVPGEILVLGPNGGMTVTNELDDRGAYMHALLQPDDGEPMTKSGLRGGAMGLPGGGMAQPGGGRGGGGRNGGGGGR